MRISVCHLPDNLLAGDTAFSNLAEQIRDAEADIAVLNEMPFGPWLARQPFFDEALAVESVQTHDMAVPQLSVLPAAVITSRPVAGTGRLINEAFIWAENRYQPIHQKQYFPQEPGFYEASWFMAERPGFEIAEYRGLRFGVLLCTELMFTEWARHYRRQGAHVIVSPRASGVSMGRWRAAARMAAIMSGCYVLSSNRISAAPEMEPEFGGSGFAYGPDGELLGETSESASTICVSIDLQRIAAAQSSYPCTVREIAATPP